MRIKLEALNECIVFTKDGLKEIETGKVVEADFSEFGVSLKVGNRWTKVHRIAEVEKNFKVYNQ